MPTSNLSVWPELLALIAQVPHAAVLDVGPGRGKGAPLIREYVAGVARIDAVEGWPDYITPRLEAAYDAIFALDVMLMSASALAMYDVVLLADVIEHLSHEDGLTLLDRIRGAIVISTPRDYFQNTAEVEAGIWTEDHRSHWTVEEFTAMPRCDVAYVNAVGAVVARLRAA